MKQKKQEQIASSKNANELKGEQMDKDGLMLQKIPKVPRLLQLHGSTGVQQQKVECEQLGINKWKIGKYLGGGAFGQVYKALNVKNGVLSAVKKISFMKEEEDVCKDEIAVLAKIHHENIVRYLQHYHFEDETWIFMEYVPQTLQSFYRDFGPPLYANFMHFARQLITALEYLHKKNIVHKDIKCENVLLTSKGIVKLTDYGCSKGFDRTISIVNYQKSGNRTQKGTAFWMAPESVTISCYSRSSDIWSLGCTLLELATGKRPWSQTNLDDYRVMIHIGTTEDIPFIPDDLHSNIKKLIQCCLKREPSQRLDAKELLKFVQSLE